MDNLNLDISSAYHPVSLRHRNRAEITGSPIRYGFRAGVKANRN